MPESFIKKNSNSTNKTFGQLYDKPKERVKVLYTDDWEVYNKAIPKEHLAQGKHTVGIEQNRSSVCHYLSKNDKKNQSCP